MTQAGETSRTTPTCHPEPKAKDLAGDVCRVTGFTLVELIVAVAITSILMLAIGSAIVVATHALPDNDGPAGAVIAAGSAAEQIAAELQYAVSINQRSATMIEFTVADRNGNGEPEIIRYEWSATAGDPLTRQYNAGTVTNVLDSVQQFDLSYDTETVTTETTTASESAETLLISYDSVLALTDYAVKDNQWWGQYFKPSLPGDAISWKVTRVEFYAKIHGGNAGECKVQLQAATTGGFPSGLVLEQKTLLESTLLYTYLKQQFNFTGVSGLPPDRGLCLVFEWVSDSDACDIRGRSPGGGTASSHVVKSTNQGALWSARVNDSFAYWVYGTVTTSGTPQVDEADYLHSVGVKLRSGADQQSNVRTRVKTLNQPEVTP